MRVLQSWNERGFTLLELIISIALLGVIVLIVSSGMRMGFRAAESGQKKTDTLIRLRTTVTVLESQIQSIFAIRPAGLTYDENFAQFAGESTSMEFRTLYSLLGGSKGPAQVRYFVKDELNGKALYGAEISAYISGQMREVKFIEKAHNISFEYYDSAGTEAAGGWQTSWNIKDRLPSMVRITIEKEGAELSLVIPVRIGMQSGQARSNRR